MEQLSSNSEYQLQQTDRFQLYSNFQLDQLTTLWKNGHRSSNFLKNPVTLNEGHGYLNWYQTAEFRSTSNHTKFEKIGTYLSNWKSALKDLFQVR